MSDDMKRYVCIPSGQGLRTLTFPDGCRISVMNLTEILETVYEEGRPSDPDTAGEILKRLEATNYVPRSSRQEYLAVLLEEYRQYVRSRQDNQE